jgi:hypothetical protein
VFGKRKEVFTYKVGHFTYRWIDESPAPEVADCKMVLEGAVAEGNEVGRFKL